MPDCGSQCWLCDLPIRFDTYKGCSHGCKYCFVQRKNTLDVEMGETAKALISFIKGERTQATNWADWNIPLHWGGMSDPFQPCERVYKRSLEALKVFAQSKYPVVISTKGKLCTESPWIDEIEKCNVVMQISALCSKYDALEPGAPTFEERLGMIKTLAPKVKRVIVRAQPYVHDIFHDMMENIPRFAEAGAHGIIFEGMKFAKKKPGLVKCAGDWVQDVNVLRSDFEKLKAQCHKYGLKFYSGENRLRGMGDSLTCCGVADLDGFKVNEYNLSHIINGDTPTPTDGQKHDGSGSCFAGIFQESDATRFCRKNSFATMVVWYAKHRAKYVTEALGHPKRTVSNGSD